MVREFRSHFQAVFLIRLSVRPRFHDAGPPLLLPLLPEPSTFERLRDEASDLDRFHRLRGRWSFTKDGPR